MWATQYKDLIWTLTISDLKVKYQNSILGFGWSLLNPLLMMLVLYAVFINIFRVSQENFALYLLVGLIVWRFFAIGTTMAMSSITGRPALVTKIYIPRQILVLSTTFSCFISSVLEFIVLIPLIIVFGVKITPYIFSSRWFMRYTFHSLRYIPYSRLIIRLLPGSQPNLGCHSPTWFFSFANRVSNHNHSCKIYSLLHPQSDDGTGGNLSEFPHLWFNTWIQKYTLSHSQWNTPHVRRYWYFSST